MPEPNFLSLYSYNPEPPKKAPIIKLSCGIGDTDGFPAFDVDSEQYAAKDDSKWGFLITGGAEFHMPLTVFQVTPDGLADKGGICLGDIILEINEEDATQLTLSQAHEKINASAKKIHFLVKSMDEEESMEGYEPGEEKCIVLRVPKPPAPPKVSTIERRLEELHRKLSEIAEIPKILSSTLAAVSQTFDTLTNSTLPITAVAAHCLHSMQEENELNCHRLYESEQKRKLSYDEDLYDYELSDSEEADQSESKEKFDATSAYLQLKHYAAKQKKSKDVTPESDYASENNYEQNETHDDAGEDALNDNAVADSSDNDDGDNDDDIKNCDIYEEFNLSVLETSLGHISNQNDTDQYQTDDDDNNNDEEDDEDFLTTTFTWNLCNKQKGQINDSADLNKQATVNDTGDYGNKEEENVMNVVQKKSLNTEENTWYQNQKINDNLSEKEQKLDKLERSWPWADREKIIYKQSTCHLVPHKPLGLIEQRIQLLAKRNLLEHLNKTKKPQ